MKKLTLGTLTVFLLMAIAPMQLNAMTKSDTISIVSIKPVDSEKSEALLARLNEIKMMDKSSLTSSDKKQLRIEARSIKKALKANSGGIYLSAGAIIIIILLLIILL